MKEKKIRTQLKAAFNTYNFFQPQTNKNIEVWAYLLRNSIEDDIYGENTRIFDFELYTDAMIRYDYEHFTNNDFSGFIPIGYTFTSIMENSTSEADKNSRIFREFSSRYIRCILKPIDELTASDKIFMEGTVSISAPFTFSEDTSDILEQFYHAALVFIDSTPYSAAQDSLIALNTVNDSANAIVNNSLNQFNSREANADHPYPYTYVRIYKVGCANTICIKHHSGKTILFDCGLDIKNPVKYAITKNHIIKNIKPNVIIISHWHKDHYNMLEELDLSHLECIIYNGRNLCPWQIKSKILAPLTLKGKTVDLSKIAFTPDCLVNNGYDGVKIFIGKGSTPTSNQYGIIPKSYNTTINDSGIMLCVGNLKLHFNRIILPSDVSYYNWPDAPELKLDLYLSRLLVPHHGGSVYAAPNFNNPAPYKRIYVSRNEQHVPITDCHKKPNIDTCHVDFLQKGMHMASSNFFYTDSLSTKPYYETRITPD